MNSGKMKAHCTALMFDYLSGSEAASEKSAPAAPRHQPPNKITSEKSQNVFKSVIPTCNDLISGISSKIEAAISDMRLESASDSAMRNGGNKNGGVTKEGHSSNPFTRKLRLPQLKTPLSFEDYSSLSRRRREKREANINSTGTSQSSVDSEESNTGVNSFMECDKMILKADGIKSSNVDTTKVPEAANSGTGSDGDEVTSSVTSVIADGNGNPGSESDTSLQSLSSTLSYGSSPEDSEAIEFMRKFVDDLFADSTSISLEIKAKFGHMVRGETGRTWFARFVNSKRAHCKKVDETTFYSLVQYFAIVLFECCEADDFSPAKTLMNMCFTFYHEVAVPGCEAYKEFLYTCLKDQLIWRSLRFWNAAFFDAILCERAQMACSNRGEERIAQENITFGQLGTFTCNMHAFALEKDLCLEFLRKQSIIGNLQPEQCKMLQENVERMYKETQVAESRRPCRRLPRIAERFRPRLRHGAANRIRDRLAPERDFPGTANSLHLDDIFGVNIMQTCLFELEKYRPC
ncbi:unnamed protein product [Darwinula stevensoni]|uniref:SBF1/SBF2 domain-containing protein n=1 Tax=Darwinula stevensoni TaxID=69355 RepID=A0A7R9A2U3_9CRUS|nr:unnamed protein product [Darwinula stevensoni]CAG0890399.1 unnamed protein product [Darwinula stevensoni]